MSALENAASGMTGFTQRALMEIDRMEDQKRTRETLRRRMELMRLTSSSSSAASPLTPPPRRRHKPRDLSPLPPSGAAHLLLQQPQPQQQRKSSPKMAASGALTPQPRRSSFDAANWKKVQRGALMLQAQMSDVAKSVSIVIPEEVKLARADETFHHLHHLEKKQENIRRLEAERIAAEEKAKADAVKLEQQKERRLQRQHQSKIAAFDKAERKIQMELGSLNDHHDDLQRAGIIRPFDVVSMDGDDSVKVAVGDRVTLTAPSTIRRIYGFDGSEVPSRLMEHIGDVGSVIAHGPAPELVAVKFDCEDEALITFKGCLRTVHMAKCAPVAPMIVSESGEVLELQKADTIVEIIGSVCIVNHTASWVYPSRLHSPSQEVALIVPTPQGSTLLNVTARVGASSIACSPLADTDAQDALDDADQSRKQRLAKRASMVVPNNTAVYPAQSEAHPEVERSQPGDLFPIVADDNEDVDDDEEDQEEEDFSESLQKLEGGASNMNSTRRKSRTGGIWTDAFSASHGRSGQDSALVPLREASVGTIITIVVRVEVPLVISLSSANDQEAWEMFYPCQYPEKCLANKNVKFDDVVNVQFVVAGFMSRSIRLDTVPATKLQKGTTMSGTRPLYVTATKAGPWKNNGIRARFSLEPNEEMGVHVFVEADPSAYRTDSFVAIVYPTQMPKEGRFARVVAIVADMPLRDSDSDGVRDDLREAVGDAVGVLAPTDFFLVAVHRGGSFWVMGSEQFADDAASTGELVRRCVTEVRNVEHARTASVVFLDTFEKQGAQVCTSFADFIQHANSALSIVARSRIDLKATKQPDAVREIVCFATSDLSTHAQQSVASMMKTAAITMRFHCCFVTSSMLTSTGCFYRALCSRLRGLFVPAYGYETRLRQMLGFSRKLARPIVADVDISFPHTADLELFGGGRVDIGCGRFMVVAGRYTYAAGDNGETVSITGRMSLGKKFVRRQLCPKISIPVSRAYARCRVLHFAATAWFAALTTNTNFDAHSVIEKACQFAQPLSLPRDMIEFAPSDEFTSVNEGSFAMARGSVSGQHAAAAASLTSPRLASGSGSNNSRGLTSPMVPGLLQSPTSAQFHNIAASVGLYVYQLSNVDKPRQQPFPPTFATVVIGSSPPGSRLWSDYLRKKVTLDKSGIGVFARVGAAPPDAMQQSYGGTSGSIPLVEWLQKEGDDFNRFVESIEEREVEERRAIEDDEWSTFLHALHTFHQQRLHILKLSIFLQRGLSEVEEDERVHRKAMLADEISEWRNFTDRTEHTRGIMARVNLFAEEGRRRLVYAEEDVRAEIATDQQMLWRFALMVRSTAQVATTTADVAFVNSVIDHFSNDADKMNLVACALAAWTSFESCATVFGMEGGVGRVKRLLTVFPSHESIVESLVITVSHLSAIRTNHGKLESCSILFDVMHAAHMHELAFGVQAAVIRCYSALAAIALSFRQTLINSEKGLCALLQSFTRHIHHRQLAFHMFQFVCTIAGEAQSHRSIAELGIETMAVVTMIVHPRDEALRYYFFRALGTIASSRTLRVMIANMSPAIAVIITTLLSPHSTPRVAAEAIVCLEKVCGNVGDYPSVTVATSVVPVLRKHLQLVNPAVVPGAVIERCHRLLTRLTVCPLPPPPQCDDVLMPLARRWEDVQILGVSQEHRGSFPSLYGALCDASIVMGGPPITCLAKVFSRLEMSQYLLTENLSAEDTERSAWSLYAATLSLQLQDVLENSFVRHPSQLRCIGFSTTEDGIHFTLFSKPPGPSLSQWLEKCIARKTPLLLSSWLALAFAVFDVCAFHGICNSVHGGLSIDAVFCEEDPSVEVPTFVIGPTAAVTRDIISQIPENQVSLDVEELAVTAAKETIDDAKDARHVLLDALNYGDALDGNPTQILSRIPRDLAQMLFGLEEDDSRFRLPVSEARDLSMEYLSSLTPAQQKSMVIALPSSSS